MKEHEKKALELLERMVASKGWAIYLSLLSAKAKEVRAPLMDPYSPEFDGSPEKVHRAVGFLAGLEYAQRIAGQTVEGHRGRASSNEPQ